MNVDGFQLNNFLVIIDRPLIPPKTILLGSKNKLKETAIRNKPTNK